MTRRPHSLRAHRGVATGLLATASALALGVTVLPGAAASPPRNPVAGQAGDQSAAHRQDDRPGPLTKEHQRLRTKALAMLDNGSATLQRQPGGGATVEMTSADGPSEYVEFPVGRTDKIWTVLADFSDLAHNSIPQPDRSVDNSTYWEPSFDRAYYEDLFNGPGESMRNFYEQQSSGRYSVANTVEDWVTVPGTMASYGGNRVEDSGGAWQFIADSVNAWYSAQVAAGVPAADIKAHLSALDEWDRYDFDGDGDFNEPDGYIDHFQAVHAGMGEEAGASPDTIWSHRWYVNQGGYGSAGPTVDGVKNLYGGTQVGSSGLWIGDYTVEPENGGLGVFAHEFGHDLGLPDYYDVTGGENGTGFWTLMSSGSWLSHGAVSNEGTGNTPGLMGPEEKLELGWLDYSEVNAGQSSTFTLGPAAHTYNGADQAVKVNLPGSSNTVTNAVPAGGHAWWTGRGDNLHQFLTRSVPAASRVTVTASANYVIEKGYDFLYGEYSLDNGDTWQRAGNPVSGSSNGRWAGLRFAYVPNNQPSLFRFHYATDGGYNEYGAYVDDITIKAGSATVFTDDAEQGTNGWTVRGWRVSDGTDTVNAQRYYLLENRQYVGYDETLGQGPYNYDRDYTNWYHLEWFAYRPGMLVWSVDQSVADNDTSRHPGTGAALPVDARPAPMTYPNGQMPDNRKQTFDATFGPSSVPELCLHDEFKPSKAPKSPIYYEAACAASNDGIATFDDSEPMRYWSADNPWNSVQVAGVGVRATVTADNGGFLTVDVSNPAAP